MPQCLRVLHLDACYIVISKPAGLLSVPGRSGPGCDATTILTRWCESRNDAVVRAATTNRSPLLSVERQRDFEYGISGDTLSSPLSTSTTLSFTSVAQPRGPRRREAILRGWIPFALPPRTTSALTPLPAHRLDEATSGLLLFAWTTPALRSAMLHFAGRTMGKVYEAVVDTRYLESGATACSSALMCSDHGVITTPLRRHSHAPLLGEPGGRETMTQWRVLERGRGAARLELRPMTGRTHQLRLHCALPPPLGLGAPIIGDRFYGDPELAVDSYALELLKRGNTCGASNSVAGLLAMQYTAKRRALRAGSSGSAVAPQLASCRYLDGAATRSVPVASPRLLLHATELHIPDLLHGARGSPEAAAALLRWQQHDAKWPCRSFPVDDSEVHTLVKPSTHNLSRVRLPGSSPGDCSGVHGHNGAAEKMGMTPARTTYGSWVVRDESDSGRSLSTDSQEADRWHITVERDAGLATQMVPPHDGSSDNASEIFSAPSSRIVRFCDKADF